MISLQITSQQTQNKWDKICNDVYHHMKEDFKKTKQLQSILSDIRKLYKITPARLKKDTSKETQDIRLFTLYLLVNYSLATFEQIVEQFDGITIKTLEDIQNDTTLDTKYKTQIKEFLDISKDGFLSNIYQNLAFYDDINKFLEGSK